MNISSLNIICNNTKETFLVELILHHYGYQHFNNADFNITERVVICTFENEKLYKYKFHFTSSLISNKKNYITFEKFFALEKKGELISDL